MLCKVHTCTIIDRHACISCFRTGVYSHTFGVSGLFILLIERFFLLLISFTIYLQEYLVGALKKKSNLFAVLVLKNQSLFQNIAFLLFAVQNSNWFSHTDMAEKMSFEYGSS